MAGKKKSKGRGRAGQARSSEKAVAPDVPPSQPANSRTSKVQITLRLDADVVDYFRAKGPGYQGKMESYLLLMMDQQKFRASTDDPGDPWIPINPTHESMGNEIFRPRKVQMALRLDAEMLRHFRATGKGYQTRINRDLRLVMVELISGEEENEEPED